MNKLTLYLTLFIFSTLISLTSSANSQTLEHKDKRPNFIFILIDDLEWSQLGIADNSSAVTPHIDTLARQGVRFDNAYLTTASCSASRASILTSRYPHNTGAPNLHDPLPDIYPTIASELSNAGYFTASIGKWHTGSFITHHFNKILPGGNDSGTLHWFSSLASVPKDKPFFLLLNSDDPHRPFTAEYFRPKHNPNDVWVPPYLGALSFTRKQVAAYMDEVTRIDSKIGLVMKQLKQQQLDNNTIVILASDNGAPWSRAKTTLYTSGIKTPLIIRWPNAIEPNTVNTQLVSIIDIAPTMLTIAGIPIPPTFQGESMFNSLLIDPRTEIRPYAFAERNNHVFHLFSRAVVDKNYLYIRNTFPKSNLCNNGYDANLYRDMHTLKNSHPFLFPSSICFDAISPREELYYLPNDPHNLISLVKSTKQSHQDALINLRTQLDKWRKETQDKNDHCPIFIKKSICDDLELSLSRPDTWNKTLAF